MLTSYRSSSLVLAIIFALLPCSYAQNPAGSTMPYPHADENAEKVAQILEISGMVAEVRAMRLQRPCGSAATLQELSMRQDLVETIMGASLDVDGVLGELESERAQLSELSARLQSRRDRSVNLANVANLITGTGVGIGVNALQFSSSAANIGNGLGVGSGIGSTLLSIVGIRVQRGPKAPVGKVPNMLAPLFGKETKLNTYYSPDVMAYLRDTPTGNSSTSRLEQLKAEWQDSGRVGPAGDSKTEKKVSLLTASSDDKTKLSIDDLGDRISMLSDVTGKVALMKRDLAALMMSSRANRNCPAN